MVLLSFFAYLTTLLFIAHLKFTNHPIIGKGNDSSNHYKLLYFPETLEYLISSFSVHVNVITLCKH